MDCASTSGNKSKIDSVFYNLMIVAKIAPKSMEAGIVMTHAVKIFLVVIHFTLLRSDFQCKE